MSRSFSLKALFGFTYLRVYKLFSQEDLPLSNKLRREWQMIIFWRKCPRSHCKKLNSFWEVNLCPSEVTVSPLPQPHREDNPANTTFPCLFTCIFPNLRLQYNRTSSGEANQGTENMILSMKQKSRQSIRRGTGRGGQSQVVEAMACPAPLPLPIHTAQCGYQHMVSHYT